MKFEPRCLATGIGSVPHTDPDEAVKFVFSYFPEIPNWPQVPMKGSQEGFLNQFMAPLLKLGLIVTRGGKFFFDTEQEEWAMKLAGFYELYLAAVEGDQEALDFFRFSEESASGFYAFIRYLEGRGPGKAKYLKGQISGPLTVGLALTDQDRRAAYYNPQARDVLVKTLSLQGLIQAKTLSRFGLPVIVFVDDPGLYASGQSTFITLKKDEIVTELNSIYKAVRQSGALTGTHSCAGMDWSILFESEVDIISFDAFSYFVSVSSYIGEMKEFLDRGGSLAWGIIPTAAESLSGQSVESLQGKLEEHISCLAGKGLDRGILLDRAVITPGCGTGTLSPELAVRVHELTRDLSERLRAGQGS